LRQDSFVFQHTYSLVVLAFEILSKVTLFVRDFHENRLNPSGGTLATYKILRNIQHLCTTCTNHFWEKKRKMPINPIMVVNGLSNLVYNLSHTHTQSVVLLPIEYLRHNISFDVFDSTRLHTITTHFCSVCCWRIVHRTTNRSTVRLYSLCYFSFQLASTSSYKMSRHLLTNQFFSLSLWPDFLP